jgi:hypothetical protein
MDKSRCTFAANVGRGAARIKAEAGTTVERPRRTRTSTKAVDVDDSSSSSSSSSTEEPPAKRKKPASKGKSKARIRGSGSASSLRRALKELQEQILAQQATVNAMLVTLSRVQDKVEEMEDA